MEKENRVLIVESDSYEAALEKGLLQLQLGRDQVDVEIIDQKKGFIFKKALVKLQLTEKSPEIEPLAADTIIDQEALFSELEQFVEKDEAKKQYQLDFREDGVYLLVAANFNEKKYEDELLEYLKKKKFKDYDREQISLAISNKNQPFKIAPAQNEFKLDSEIKVNVARDKMSASLLLLERDGGKAADLDQLLEALANAQVTYGIDEELLKKIALVESTNDYMVVAKGKASIDGIDGRAIYRFNTDKSFNPTLLEDGTVDFKQLNLIKNVSKGELLVELIMPTEGVPGTDVLGGTIPPKKGKEVRIKKGKNTVESEDGTKLYAAVQGQVTIEDGKISVSEVYQVNGDVDNSTGNIRFNGSVVINGNVKSGFTIQADGNIEVTGVVEGATLITKGNITLSRGIQGNNQAFLECGGDLKVKYVENAKIKCRGSIFAEAVLHSDVVAKNKVMVGGKKGLIAGGDIRAGEEIRATTIGSHMGTTTRLEVGIDPEERMKLEQVKAELQETNKNSQNLKKTIDLLSRVARNGQMPKTKEEILVKSLKTYEFLKEKETQLNEEYKILDEKVNLLGKGKIHVSDTIYPGVKVIILNATRFIYDELANCTLSRKDGEIVIGPFER